MTKRTAFIGHRHLVYGSIKNKLIDIIKNEIDNECNKFIMGTHGNFDITALEICRFIRSNYKQIEIKVVLTSLNTVKKDIYNSTYTPYNDVNTFMFDIENEYYKRQIIVSNKKMIDISDTLICYVNPKSINSGAKLIYNYAKRKGLKIINLFNENL